MKEIIFTFVICNLAVLFPAAGFSQTQILKWQDGKEGCVTLTCDDGSENQFRIAVPLTLRTVAPASWKTAGLRQGAREMDLPVQREGGAAFVQYRAAPNSEKNHPGQEGISRGTSRK